MLSGVLVRVLASQSSVSLVIMVSGKNIPLVIETLEKFTYDIWLEANMTSHCNRQNEKGAYLKNCTFHNNGVQRPNRPPIKFLDSFTSIECYSNEKKFF